jgi:hypothetical protein
LDKGKVVYKMKQTKLYENPANEVKNAMNQPRSEIEALVRKYYPEYKESSLKAITKFYVNFAKGKYPSSPVTQQLQKIYKRRHHKRKPVGALAFEKTYQIWVKPEFTQKVKVAVNKFGIDYKPDYITLLRETGLNRSQLLGTLKYMLENQMLIKKRPKDKQRSIIYQPVIRLDIDEIK